MGLDAMDWLEGRFYLTKAQRGHWWSVVTFLGRHVCLPYALVVTVLVRSVRKVGGQEVRVGPGKGQLWGKQPDEKRGN